MNHGERHLNLLRSWAYSSSMLESNELNKEWIAGIRRWWKQWFSKAGAISKMRGEKAYLIAMDYLRDGLDNIDRIARDLAIKKNLWPHGITGEKALDLKSNVNPMIAGMWTLDDARKALHDVRSQLEARYNSIYVPGSLDYQSMASSREKKWGRNRDMDALDSYIEEWFEKDLVEVDKRISGQLFRRLTSFISKWEGSGLDLAEPGIDMDFSIGRMKVLVQPTESGQYRPRDFSPLMTKRVSPSFAKEYLAGIKQAKALLDKAGFGRIWYGSIMARPYSTGYEFTGQASGTKYTTIGHYQHASDVIVLNLRVPESEEVARTLVHELGHRWYYKIMTSPDRARFDSYFGKVPAVKSYGRESPSEDFATAFEYYVMGDKLTRDQRERFKEFAVKGKGVRRMESLGDDREILFEKKQDLSVLGLASVTQDGVRFETGKSVTFKYCRNPEKAPYLGAMFGQDIEPAGKYVNFLASGDNVYKGLELGTATLSSPIVMNWTGYGLGGWKARLSRFFGGKKKKVLTRAIRAAGYDGIVTVRGDEVSEVIIL